MRINFNRYHFTLGLKKTITLALHPPFVMRSVLGKELRALTCLFKKRHCDRCDLRFNCPYSYIFETPIRKDNPTLPGRNRAPHPFIIATEQNRQETTDHINLTVTLLGKADTYIPHIYYALKKAGEHGLFKERTTYTIDDVTCNNTSILSTDGTLHMPDTSRSWELDTRRTGRKKTAMLLTCNTPLRFKKNNTYRETLSYDDILTAAARKVKLLSAFHGTPDDTDTMYEQLGRIDTDRTVKSNLYWVDLHRFSARQRKKLKLGGVVGTMEIPGPFTRFERSLLAAAELFNLGKNQSFDLGNVTVREVH